MKKNALFLSALMICGIASAQFAGGMRGQQQEPLPDGYKPASTNTFLSQYPAVNAQTRQAIFRVVAPGAGTPDHLHFTSEGYRILGKRYAVRMLSLPGYNINVP
ncbi:MAG: hypothetical protein WAV93_08280 [Bacteroidales bacterium]